MTMTDIGVTARLVEVLLEDVREMAFCIHAEQGLRDKWNLLLYKTIAGEMEKMEEQVSEVVCKLKRGL